MSDFYVIYRDTIGFMVDAITEIVFDESYAYFVTYDGRDVKIDKNDIIAIQSEKPLPEGY